MTNIHPPYKVKPIGLNGQDQLIALVRYFAHPSKLKILPAARLYKVEPIMLVSRK